MLLNPLDTGTTASRGQSWRTYKAQILSIVKVLIIPPSPSYHLTQILAASRLQYRLPIMATYASAYSSYQHPQGQQPSSKPQYASQQKANPTWINPPYPGAPPVPAGMSVNPQQWKAGRWHYNPAWNQNHNPQQQHVPWIPSHHWMPHLNQQSNSSAPHSQQQHQQQAVNPYKRVPRPPSAEYLATELVQNPLGLTGLDEPK